MEKEVFLCSKTARRLYDHIKEMPIIDYHNHLSVSDIVENKRYINIYDLWIKPDPYKHRAMRMRGVSENEITGAAADFEKFKAWCKVYPKLIGTPLYVWSQMELQSIFGISERLCEENAEKIYRKANDFLAKKEITPEYFFERFHVEQACPCISLTDDVAEFANHKKISPSLRGDDISLPDLGVIKKLEAMTNKIADFQEYKEAIRKRMDALTAAGCKFSDHGLDNGFEFFEDDGKNDIRFDSLLTEEPLSNVDSLKLFSHLLVFLCGEYAKRNITVQLHIGAQRYTSTRLRTLAGAAGGFAGIGNSADVVSLTRLFDTLEQREYGLPKIVLFTLNPSDNAMFSVLSGSYSKDNIRGLITQGPAWWWCDHKYGITEFLENISSFGLLSNFIGMTTDSRSFLSFVRHDYFRRILCEWLGKKFDDCELCCTEEELKMLLEDMCYRNAKE